MNLRVRQAGGPELAPVVGEAAMMRLVTPADRDRLDRLAESGRAFSHVDGDELVGAVAHALDAERPDIDVVLLAGDLRHVGRLAGLVGKRRAGGAGEKADGRKAAGGDAASSGTQGSCFAVAPPESMAGIRRCGPPTGLCGMSLAPLRGGVLRWVPGRIPLSLHAPGKAVERAAPKPSTALSRKPVTQRSGVEGYPGPSARLAAKRRRISS